MTIHRGTAKSSKKWEDAHFKMKNISHAKMEDMILSSPWWRGFWILIPNGSEIAICAKVSSRVSFKLKCWYWVMLLMPSCRLSKLNELGHFWRFYIGSPLSVGGNTRDFNAMAKSVPTTNGSASSTRVHLKPKLSSYSTVLVHVRLIRRRRGPVFWLLTPTW